MKRRRLLALLGASTPGLAGCAALSSDGDPETTSGTTAGTTTDGSTGAAPSAAPNAGPTTTTAEPAAPTGTDSSSTSTAPAVPCDGSAHPFLSAPDGFTVQTFADREELGGGPFDPGPNPGPRMLEAYDGTLFASIPDQGRVVALPDEDDTGTASRAVTVTPTSLDRPHGIAFREDHLYLATAGSVLRYRMDGFRAVEESKETLVDDVPVGEYHWTRSIAIHDSRLYLAVGNCPSGSCSGGDPFYHAQVTAMDLDGSNVEAYVTGLRNAVGIEASGDALYVTDNGIDDLGPDLPPDEINVLEEGRDYGFPDCYGDNVPVGSADGSTATASEPCSGRATPAVELQAHVAPLGFCFGDSPTLPEVYRGDAYVALHGSWTREDPVGYEVIRVPFDEGSLGSPETFVEGWMPDAGTKEDARGRPADVHVGPDGALYVTDDMAGAIHRICYAG